MSVVVGVLKKGVKRRLQTGSVSSANPLEIRTSWGFTIAFRYNVFHKRAGHTSELVTEYLTQNQEICKIITQQQLDNIFNKCVYSFIYAYRFLYFSFRGIRLVDVEI